MIPDNYPAELLDQAEAALTKWYSKKLKTPELEQKVRRVLQTQFPSAAELIDAK